MLATFRQALARRRLRNPDYTFLFDPPPPDEAVCFDCETTGLDRKADSIVQIAAVRIKGRRVLTSQRLNLMVRPPAGMTAGVIKIHHLRQQDVADGLEPLEAMDRFLRFVGSRPLVGYYLEFDVAMVNRLIRPWLGIGLPQRQIEVSSLYYDYRTSRGGGIYTGNVDLRLSAIMEDLNLPRLKAHDAFNDAVMTALAYVKLKAR
ncbi:3'-5' exonuclease [Novispirillum itersonii]|uniref:DNA polymerase-3 subunit epsilon n=1 Tax=Novispirillum itersonii TaxID=189 RepID=A0A7W9ZGD3_NOVIT|nr:3'-5' exonuclease [Novispirillum itersonii]MBB6209559.1 DNA polymerase-3 subunit epsilon [Novispirillum itersonii]